jgi:hypothetical protein
MKTYILFFFLTLLSYFVLAQNPAVSTSIPYSNQVKAEAKYIDYELNSILTSTDGAVQIENDGFRKFGTTRMAFYFGTSNLLPPMKFFPNGIIQSWNGANGFGIGTNSVGDLEFIANGNELYRTTNTKMTINDISGNVGINVFNPAEKLDVDGNLRLSKAGLGFGSRNIQFYSDNGSANEWRPGYLASADNGNYTGRLDFFTNGTGFANKTGSQLGLSIATGGVQIPGGTQLGTNAPVIKMKKLAGTFNANTPIPTTFLHGLNYDKILAVDMFLKPGSSSVWYHPAYNSVSFDYGYRFRIDATGIILQNIDGAYFTSGATTQYKILITYEE